mmetsp:Transcript_24194/g.71819  ORF Transcript_24194/g.71819 Transcript_24194/m.71819 type:complete len:226 (+) Transcript_24194:305-982(+)
MLSSWPHPAIMPQLVQQIHTGSRVNSARGSISEFPSSASSIVPSERPSSEPGSMKLRRSCGSGDSANMSVAAHPGSCSTVRASARRPSSVRMRYATPPPPSSSASTHGSAPSWPPIAMLPTICGMSDRPTSPTSSCQVVHAGRPPPRAMCEVKRPARRPVHMATAAATSADVAANTTAGMKLASATRHSTSMLLSMPMSCTLTALRSPRPEKCVHMSMLPSSPLR